MKRALRLAAATAGPLLSSCPPAPVTVAPAPPCRGWWRLAAPVKLRAGPALVGEQVLYRCNLDGWVQARGRVRCVCKWVGSAASRTVTWSPGGLRCRAVTITVSPLGTVDSEANSLLDASSHGPPGTAAGRWHLLRQLSESGQRARCRASGWGLGR